MKVCLIYSGWLRTYEQCKAHHKEMLIATEINSVHINEYNTVLHYHTEDIEEYNTNKAPETVVRHSMNQWRNNWLAFQLAPKGFDFYVRIRYDIEFTNNINFFTYNCEDNVIYIPEGNDYREGCNDQLAFGNYMTMEKYYSVYQNHESIFKRGHQFHTESYLKQNHLDQGVRIVRIPTMTIIKR